MILDRTAFYPGGGGQPSDAGTLAADDGTSWPVTGLKSIDRRAVHLLGDERPPVGSTVHGVIDWDRRYLLMRTHTAMHILCGVVWRDYQAQVTGGNMEPGKGRLDFAFERMDTTLVSEIEEKLNVEVVQGFEALLRGFQLPIRP